MKIDLKSIETYVTMAIGAVIVAVAVAICYVAFLGYCVFHPQWPTIQNYNKFLDKQVIDDPDEDRPE